MNTFMNGDFDITSIDAAGEKLLVALYGGEEDDSLNNLRYRGLSRSVTKSKSTSLLYHLQGLQYLQHSLRTFHHFINCEKY